MNETNGRTISIKFITSGMGKRMIRSTIVLEVWITPFWVMPTL